MIPEATSQIPNVTISIDAMGGDAGPKPVVYGLDRVARHHDHVNFIIHGPADDLNKYLRKRSRLRDRVRVVDCQKIITMDDKPSQVLRRAAGTSMLAALEAVRDGQAQACVSCGNTGALMALSMIRLRKISGVNRPAISVLWPSNTPQGFTVVLDAGADIRADEQDLLQYAHMGTAYARNGLNVRQPRVGILNIGTESHKGPSSLHLAHELLEKEQAEGRFEFIGFVEGSHFSGGQADVIVTDGFSGNIALKTGEGTASFIGNKLRSAFTAGPISRLAALTAGAQLMRFRKSIDPRRVNGGVFLGLNGTVIKSHGSADSTGVEAAVSLAARLAQSNLTQKISDRLMKIPQHDPQATSNSSKSA